MNPTLRDNLRELARAATMFAIVFCIITIFALSAGKGPSPRTRTHVVAPALSLFDESYASPAASSDDCNRSTDAASSAETPSDNIATAVK
jgi:hypothetical protein